MLRARFLKAMVAVGATTVALLGAAPSASADATALQTVLYYDDTYAAEFRADVAAGMQAWNSSVQNVRIERAPAGRRAEIRIIADNGWPRAQLGPVRPGGQVTWWFGRQAVAQGYNRIRIAAHETGHSLGLPDIKPGPCSSLMSGSTGGVSCTNRYPNATERARVERTYSFSPATNTPAPGTIIVDSP